MAAGGNFLTFAHIEASKIILPGARAIQGPCHSTEQGRFSCSSSSGAGTFCIFAHCPHETQDLKSVAVTPEKIFEL